jgi:hypothetical protein
MVLGTKAQWLQKHVKERGEKVEQLERAKKNMRQHWNTVERSKIPAPIRREGHQDQTCLSLL